MEMSLKICETCLSFDRKLFPIKDVCLLHQINMQQIFNLPQLGGICWECKALLNKFSNFKYQVEQAQNLLSTSNMILTDMSLSKLRVCTQNMSGNHVPEQEYVFLQDVKTDILLIKAECDSIDESEINNIDDVPSDEIIPLDHSIAKDEFDIDNAQEQPKLNLESFPIYDEPRTLNLEQAQTKKKALYSSNSIYEQMKSKKSVLERNLFELLNLTDEDYLERRKVKINCKNFTKNPFKCNSCAQGFFVKSNYDKHFASRHDESLGPHKCDLCETRFKSSILRDDHKRKHSQLYVCKICKHDSTNKQGIVMHCLTKHHDDKLNEVHCKQCTSVFVSQTELDKHVKEEHKISCQYCKEIFAYKNTLKKHLQRQHSKNKHHECTVCNKTFETEEQLKVHTFKHKPPGENHCADCGKSFQKAASLISHLKNSAVHAKEIFVCSVCKKKFASKLYLEKHMKFYHMGKSKFKCGECKKIFITNWTLQQHLLTKHKIGERHRNHVCDICEKRFYSLSILKHHKLIHSEDRTLMCSYCGDTFKQRPALYNHTKLVHKVKGIKK